MERAWVRDVLRFLDFSMLHRSVWIGRCKMPEAFLEDLRLKNLHTCFQIFEIGKRGTLDQLL